MRAIEEKLSIIIPLYNGEQYIINCLDSIRKQKGIFVEVVVINDGSTDASLDIIKDYQEKYSDTMAIRIYNQNNGGQGAARNAGIEKANGRYIMFLDQDDTLVENILLDMFTIIENTDADILIGGYQRVLNGVVRRKVKLQQEEWSKFRIVAPWGKLYRKDFLINNNIRFMPIVLGEDIYFMLMNYCYSPKVIISENIYYNWTDNKNSVSNTKHKRLTEETYVLNLFMKIESIPNISVLKENKMYEYFLMKTAVWDILYTAVHNDVQAVLANEKAIWEWMKCYYPAYQKNPYLGIANPKGEAVGIRLLVWLYIKGIRWNMNDKILRMISRKRTV